MDFNKFSQFINILYDDRQKYNIDAWHIRGAFANLTEIPYRDVRDGFSKYVRTCMISKKVLDEIVELQFKCRTLFGWDENTDTLIDGAGYLGYRSKRFADILYNEIRSESEEDRNSISSKYFLVFCLASAARTSPYAFELFWKIHWGTWASHWIWDKTETERKAIGEEAFELERNVIEGLRDSIRIFDIASPNVILLLISKYINRYDYIPPMVDAIFDKVLGDTPNVKCIVIDGEGNESIITKDFSENVLPLVMNPNLLGYIEGVCKKWCGNDLSFRRKIEDVINSQDLEISYLTYFLVGKYEKADHEVKGLENLKKELEKMGGDEKKKSSDSDFDYWQHDVNCLPEKVKLANFLKCSFERLHNESTREDEFKSWSKLFNSYRFDRLSLPGEAYDYISFHRGTFQQRVLSGW